MVRKDIKEFIKTIPENITIVAATKYIDSKEMLVLYDNGITNFGENRVDSFLDKYEKLKDYRDIKWHFIGHLQRNKAKQIINKIDYLHSLDSLELAYIISKNRTTPLKVFVEVSINLEESKNGVPYYEVKEFVSQLRLISNIEICGFMMMAIKGSDDTQTQFRKLKELRNNIENELNMRIPYLSMGMSDDYLEAIKEGATHIRLGRILYTF